jgi:protein gp37
MRRHAVWGPNEPRVEASESYWQLPARWNRAAEKAGERRRVFCASVADVFEDRSDLDPIRERLWGLIEDSPNLDWLLLTKRPAKMARWAETHPWPANAWAGASVENQEAADERIPYLLRVPARVRFLSCEPLLGPVDLEKLWCHCCETDEHVRYNPGAQPWCIECDSEVGPASWLDPCADERQAGINWVIVGGESGRKARPMHPDWARTLRDQCVGAGVACVTWDEFPAVPT